MKKFILDCFFYAIVTALLVLGINWIYIIKRIDTEGLKKFKNVPDNITVCNFGSSHGQRSFCYEDIKNEVGFNFGLSSQSLDYDYKLLTYYASKLSRGCKVLIPISYFSLFGIDQEQKEYFQPLNRRYYRFLPSELITNYDWLTMFVENYLPSLTEYQLLPVKIFFRTQVDWFKSWPDSAKDMEFIRQDAQEAVERHILKNNYDEQGNIIFNKKAIKKLFAIIDFCKSNNFEAIMVTTPYMADYINLVKSNKPHFLETFYGLVYSIQKKTKIRYLDFSNDKEFKEITAFRNSDHLNKEFAKLFTQKILKEISDQ